MAEKRESGRIKDAASRRVLDEASRRRRQRKAIEALDQDNFQDDPHADLKMSKRAPKFEESMDNTAKNKKRKKSDMFRFRARKHFSALLEEEQINTAETPAYLKASVPSSKFPDRQFCAVCGYISCYKCVSCGARYCCVKCLGTHQDTRCLKWTA